MQTTVTVRVADWFGGVVSAVTSEIVESVRVNRLTPNQAHALAKRLVTRIAMCATEIEGGRVQ